MRGPMMQRYDWGVESGQSKGSRGFDKTKCAVIDKDIWNKPRLYQFTLGGRLERLSAEVKRKIAGIKGDAAVDRAMMDFRLWGMGIGASEKLDGALTVLNQRWKRV